MTKSSLAMSRRTFSGGCRCESISWMLVHWHSRPFIPPEQLLCNVVSVHEDWIMYLTNYEAQIGNQHSIKYSKKELEPKCDGFWHVIAYGLIHLFALAFSTLIMGIYSGRCTYWWRQSKGPEGGSREGGRSSAQVSEWGNILRAAPKAFKPCRIAYVTPAFYRVGTHLSC